MSNNFLGRKHKKAFGEKALVYDVDYKTSYDIKYLLKKMGEFSLTFN